MCADKFVELFDIIEALKNINNYIIVNYNS